MPMYGHHITRGADSENMRLACAEYWDDRYAETDNENEQLHEWFRSFKDLDEFFGRHLYEAFTPCAAPYILHLGSGDSVRTHALSIHNFRNTFLTCRVDNTPESGQQGLQ